MAHTQGHAPARAQRLTTLAAICALALTSGAAFGRIFEGAGATWRIVAAALLSALIAWGLERRSLLLAIVVSAAALVWFVAVVVFPGTLWHGLPSLDTVRAAVDAAALVSGQAKAEVAPTLPSPPLMLACIAGVWAAIFSSHALAFRAGSPVLALIPPLAVVIFADTVLDQFVRPLYGASFLAAAVLTLFADGFRRTQRWGPVWTDRSSRSRLFPTAGRSARRIAVTTLAVGIVAPLVIPGFGTSGLVDFTTSPDDRIRIDPLVSIRSDLTNDDPVEVFTVQSAAGSYWRMIALPDFDGYTWRPDLDAPTRSLSGVASLADGSGAAVGVVDGYAVVPQTFRASTDLGLPWLALGFPATAVQTDQSGVEWDPATATATLAEPLNEGDTYSSSISLVQPTPDELRAITFIPDQQPRYTALPEDTPEEIHQIAEDWTAEASTTYDKILAIQDRLRDPNEFTYSTDVPARDNSFTLVTFLEETKTGFCQQFASAMAVMLRSLGIPARVAVGFTAGRRDSATGVFHVTTDNAHSWVEVLFPTYGWLSFEPTYGRSNPIATYTDPAEDPSGCGQGRRGGCAGTIQGGQGGSITERREGTRQQLGDRVAPRGGDTTTAEIAPASPLLTARRLMLVGLALVVLAVLLVPPARAWRRRRRLRRAGHDPRRLILATYDVFGDRAAHLGFPRGEGETLEEYRARLNGSGRLNNGDLDRLTALTVAAAYAPEEPVDDQAVEAADSAEATIRELRRSTGLAQRVIGSYRRY